MWVVYVSVRIKMGECGWRERDRERERWGPQHKRIRDASMAA